MPQTCHMIFSEVFSLWNHSKIINFGMNLVNSSVQFSSVQLLSRVQLFVTPWIAAHQASLSTTNSRSLLKLMPIESVMPSSHLILCCPLLLLPPIPPSIRVFFNESTLHMRWPQYWSFSFSISLSNEHPGLISCRMTSSGFQLVHSDENFHLVPLTVLPRHYFISIYFLWIGRAKHIIHVLSQTYHLANSQVRFFWRNSFMLLKKILLVFPLTLWERHFLLL